MLIFGDKRLADVNQTNNTLSRKQYYRASERSERPGRGKTEPHFLRSLAAVSEANVQAANKTPSRQQKPLQDDVHSLAELVFAHLMSCNDVTTIIIVNDQLLQNGNNFANLNEMFVELATTKDSISLSVGI